jgi:hypothetical protein
MHKLNKSLFSLEAVVEAVLFIRVKSAGFKRFGGNGFTILAYGSGK